MTRIAALSAANQSLPLETKAISDQKRFAYWRAVDFMDPEELEICDPLSEEPRGLDDNLEIGKLNFG